MEVEAKLIFKYGTIYREVMHTKNVNFCNLMENKNDNKMLEQLIMLVNDTTPGIVHKCPDEVRNHLNF